MVRELQVTTGKSANAMCACGEDKMKTGMGVIKRESTKTFVFPTAETASDIFIVDKARVPKGVNAARKDASDYEDDFIIIESGEMGVLTGYSDKGERFATDQFAGEIGDYSEGDRMSVGTNGLWKKAGSGITSKYVFQNEYIDNGHTLALIEISDTPAANA